MSKSTEAKLNAKPQEVAVLVGVQSSVTSMDIHADLDELQSLLETAGARATKRFTQNLAHPHPKYYVGKGKLEEIKAYVLEHEIDIVAIDDELTSSQIRNLEDALTDVKVINRVQLILEIFSQNARTAQSKLQVELALCQYLMPRLTNMWTHLSKQKGGIGMKGPGETEIETDRRGLRNRIDVLKEKLHHIERIQSTQGKNRQQKKRVALIGYTNVGKSTILNLLTNSDVLVENKLFATLDSTVRSVKWPLANGYQYIELLLSDTVGFIKKLPTILVESFKTTLVEAIEADLLLHVVDVSNPNFEEQIQTVRETLMAIGATDKKEILVFNKIDKFKETDEFFVGNSGLTLEQFEKSWIYKANAPAVFISATNSENIEKLKSLVLNELFKN
jgi:GTP-binding protein HflX